jgi:basic amino acid/polyamine antiporter, APA family
VRDGAHLAHVARIVTQPARLARRLGSLDVALIVMGGVIGTGIFRTPSVVAQRAPEPSLILAAWVVGGVVWLFGAFVLGELAARRPSDCGTYGYLRDAFHPFVGFAYGWASLLAALSGGLAAAAIVFAGYFLSLTGLGLAPALVAALALAVLALLNALGVRAGANVQNGLTLLKAAGLLAVFIAGLVAHPSAQPQPNLVSGSAIRAIGIFGVAMIPVLFSYNGSQVANFMAPETKNAARMLPLGLTLGMLGVTILYVLVNAACIRVLGVAGLARTDVPVAAVFFNVMGPAGSRLISIVIALATLGFMSNRMLTVPRLYHAMAADGLFFRSVAWINPRTHVPVVAVVLQAALAIVIALSASYSHILNYIVAVVYAFTGLLALAIFVLRARDRRAGVHTDVGFRVPGHPVSTVIFMFAAWGVAIATCVAYPLDGLVSFAIVLSAVPVYFIWARTAAAQKAQA